jgi:ABC-type Fe3+-hydroxamate transport system substrate-binding protein
MFPQRSLHEIGEAMLLIGRAIGRPKEAEALLNPEIIFASWCGKPVDTDRIANRDGWHKLSAIHAGEIYPLNSDDILQPGPRILSGIGQMRAVIDRWHNSQ